MKLSVVSQGARPAPVDRNATNVTKSASASAVAPHTATTRWTYTVPSARKAVHEVSTVFIQRNTAAAPVGTAQSSVTYAPLGVSSATIHTVLLVTNNALDHVENTVAGLGDMVATDILSGLDVDNSTAGTVTFAQVAKLFEYDV